MGGEYLIGWRVGLRVGADVGLRVGADVGRKVAVIALGTLGPPRLS